MHKSFVEAISISPLLWNLPSVKRISLIFNFRREASEWARQGVKKKFGGKLWFIVNTINVVGRRFVNEFGRWQRRKKAPR